MAKIPVAQQYCEALLEMCETRKLPEITVTALIERTGTARQTFYNNFHDINDLISYVPINFMGTYAQPPYFAKTVYEAYRYARKHKGFFCQLPFHQGQNNFRDTFVAYYRDLLRKEFVTDDLPEAERLYRTIAIEQLIIGTIDTFLEWCRQQMAWPLDVLVRVHLEATPAFIRLPQMRKEHAC